MSIPSSVAAQPKPTPVLTRSQSLPTPSSVNASAEKTNIAAAAAPLQQSSSIPNQSIANDTVEVKGSQAKAETNNQETLLQKVKAFCQPVLDFFKNAYQKLMDVFTPTTKEALEKAILQTQLKAEVYEARIARSQEALSQEGISSDTQALYTQDRQKAEQKLKTLTPKIEKLSAKYTKLMGMDISEAVPQTSEAPDAKPKAQKPHQAPVNPQATVAEGAEESAGGLERGFMGVLENLFDPNGEIAQKLKQESPEIAELLEKGFKFLMK